MRYIEPNDRYQMDLLSCLEDLVPSDHPVRLIDKIVDSIVESDRVRFEKERETEVGRPRYHDSMYIKLYLYGYFNGISSSRKLEIETHRNKEVIWLIGGLCPDHWTISNYRKDKGEDIKYVTKKFREFLKDSGYIKLKTVAIDGSKVKAYTNREMLTIEKIEKKLEGIEKKTEDYLSKILENDRRDEVLEEIENEGIEPVNGKYLEKIIEMQKELEKLQKQKEILQRENRKYISSFDPEARLMKSRDGKIPGYNVQIAVDAEHKLIADSEVLTDETDMDLLPLMVESIKEELGKAPEEALADRGYNNPSKIEALEKSETEIKIYTSQSITTRDKEVIDFKYDQEKDQYVCSEGKHLVLVRRNVLKNKSLLNVYQGKECDGCLIRTQCTKSKKGRIYNRYLNQQWRDEYKTKMISRMGKARLAIRKTLVEHPFGTIKYLMGKIPLKLRGKEKVSTEINLYTTVYNLKRLFNIEEFGDLIEIIENYRWKTA
jgi:transposase